MPVRAALFDLGDTLIFQAHQPNEAALYEAMAAQVRPLLKQWNTKIGVLRLLSDLYQAVEAAQSERRGAGTGSRWTVRYAGRASRPWIRGI